MKFALSVVGLLLMTSAAAAQSVPVGSTWVNQGGSVMKITSVGSDGAVVGTYENKAQGFQCQDEEMALSGWAHGSLITFSVRWKNANVDCNSITSWTGYIAGKKIFTDWDLIYIDNNTGLPTHLKDKNIFDQQ